MSILSKRMGRLAVGVAVAAACFAVWWFLLRGPAMDDLAKLLPSGDGPTLGVDVGILRTVGVVAPAKSGAAYDPDYAQFVKATGFDYTKDLDKVVMTWRKGELSIIAAGRFDQAKIESYVKSNGGRCVQGLCTLQGSTPSRQIGFVHLRQGILGIVVSPDPLGAAALGARTERPFRVPKAPVWVTAAAGTPLPLETIPPGFRALLGALEGSHRVTLSVTGDLKGAAVEMEAECSDEKLARQVAERLRNGTEQFVSLMKRENMKVDPNGLSGLLASGRFQAESAKALGRWPLPKAMLETLTR